MSSRTKKAALGVAVIGAMFGVGIAFAAWTADGTGSGYAQAITAENLETVAATTSAQLYPGGDGDLFIVITNPNPYPVVVQSITGNGAITSDAGAACDASTGVTFDDQTGLSLSVPAESTGTPFQLTGVVHMDNTSDNSCQGAIFTIPVDLAGESDA